MIFPALHPCREGWSFRDFQALYGSVSHHGGERRSGLEEKWLQSRVSEEKTQQACFNLNQGKTGRGRERILMGS